MREVSMLQLGKIQRQVHFTQNQSLLGQGEKEHPKQCVFSQCLKSSAVPACLTVSGRWSHKLGPFKTNKLSPKSILFDDLLAVLHEPVLRVLYFRCPKVLPSIDLCQNITRVIPMYTDKRNEHAVDIVTKFTDHVIVVQLRTGTPSFTLPKSVLRQKRFIALIAGIESKNFAKQE